MKHEPKMIANNIYITNTIKAPLPVPQFPEQFVILFLLNYIQAPRIIINNINNTKTIAAPDPVPQFPMLIPPFHVLHYFMVN